MDMVDKFLNSKDYDKYSNKVQNEIKLKKKLYEKKVQLKNRDIEEQIFF